MSKALKSMGKAKKEQAVSKRLRQKHHGLGYWAAVDCRKKEVSAKKKRNGRQRKASQK